MGTGGVESREMAGTRGAGRKHEGLPNGLSCDWHLNSGPKNTKAFLTGAGDGRLVFAGEHTTKSHPGTTSAPEPGRILLKASELIL
jgi:hypothetical protein